MVSWSGRKHLELMEQMKHQEWIRSRQELSHSRERMASRMERCRTSERMVMDRRQACQPGLGQSHQSEGRRSLMPAAHLSQQMACTAVVRKALKMGSQKPVHMAQGYPEPKAWLDRMTPGCKQMDCQRATGSLGLKRLGRSQLGTPLVGLLGLRRPERSQMASLGLVRQDHGLIESLGLKRPGRSQTASLGWTKLDRSWMGLVSLMRPNRRMMVKTLDGTETGCRQQRSLTGSNQPQTRNSTRPHW